MCRLSRTRKGHNVSFEQGRVLIGLMETGIPTARRHVFVVMPFCKKEAPKRPRTDAPGDASEKEAPLRFEFDDVYQLLFNAAGLQTRPALVQRLI